MAIEDRIAQTGRKPKAIIPVHLYGMPAMMDEIMVIANEYEIPVLEDATTVGIADLLHGQLLCSALIIGLYPVMGWWIFVILLLELMGLYMIKFPMMNTK